MARDIPAHNRGVMRRAKARPGTHPLLLELDAARVAQGVSQQELAEVCGRGQNHINRLLCGVHSPTLDVLEIVARALGQKIVLVPA